MKRPISQDANKFFPPKFTKGEKVRDASEPDLIGIVERVLPPNRYSNNRHRYLVRFVYKFNGRNVARKFQYGETELRKIPQKRT